MIRTTRTGEKRLWVVREDREGTDDRPVVYVNVETDCWHHARTLGAQMFGVEWSEVRTAPVGSRPYPPGFVP